MPDENGNIRAPGRWRARLKKIGLGSLVVLALLAVFHRPIIFRGTKLLVIRLAKEQKLDLSYDIDGTIFTTLQIRNLRATPLEPGPVERLDIAAIDLRYSLVDLMREGLTGLLKELELRDAFIVIDPARSVPRAPSPKKKKAKFPAVFPQRLELGNINLTIRSPTGNTEFVGFDVSLHPADPGVIKLKTLDIPGVRRWSDLSATATFRERNLVLKQVVIGPEVAIADLKFDISMLENDELGFAVQGSFFDSPTRLSARMTDLNESNHLEVNADISDLLFENVLRYLNLPWPAAGQLKQFKISFAGVPEAPSGWKGKIEAQVDNLAWQDRPLGQLVTTVEFADGRVQATATNQLGTGNTISLRFDAALPDKLDGFIKTTGQGLVEVQASDVSAMADILGRPAQGDVSARIDFEIGNQQLSADATIDSRSLRSVETEVVDASVVIHLEKGLDALGQSPPFAKLATRTRGKIGNVRWKAYTAEALTAAMTTSEAEITLESLTLAKGANSVSFQGHYTLPDDLPGWDTKAMEGTIAVDAPQLEAFVASDTNNKLKGAVQIEGRARTIGGNYQGSFVVTGREIGINGLDIRSVDVGLKIENGAARLTQFEAVMDEKNRIDASGEIMLASPHYYSGIVKARLDNLSALDPVLRQMGRQEALGGDLALDWQGGGQLKNAQHSGAGTLDLKGARFGQRRNLAAHIEGTYTPTFIDLPVLRIAANNYEAAATVAWRRQVLGIRNFTLRQQKLTLAEGSAELPLDLNEWKNAGRLIPTDQPVKVMLRTKDLDLKNVAEQFGLKRPLISGVVDAGINAAGSIKNLTADATIRAREVRSPSFSKLAAAEIALDLALKADQLKVQGAVRQAQIQPLEINGRVPFDVDAMMRSRTFNDKAPIDLRIRLPRSSLSFIPLAPPVRSLKGTAAIDVKIGGTIGTPDFAGTAEADLDYLRFKNTSVPPINQTAIRINFTRNQATINRMAGRSAGGSFSAGGQVRFVKLSEPVFDLRLEARRVLIVQNDNLTVRASGNLALAGPLASANLSGTVFVTQSRFFKDVEILPIGLPGRPAPKPAPSAPVAVVSFPNPPLRDWKFNVAIKTADPFLIQGNLANGRAVSDLKFGGTGVRPWLEGAVRIEHLMTSLPFSRLEVTSGFIYFSPEAPFVPRLDIRASSEIRDYKVKVYIYGTRDNPQAVFTSQPPLPQSDIVALLATGTTTKELSKDPNVLAGRAALLVFQKLYRKVFKKGEPSLPEKSFFGRAQFDVGVIDPKTGRESISVKVPLSDEWVLTSGVDVGGDFRGQIKYVLRFR
ncbi:MAG: translocation/assembly module TamB domain-containing protein [Verrucomicrobiales bacterium]